MKWTALHAKIGKQPLRNLKDADVKVEIGNKTYLVSKLKYDRYGVPTLIAEEESEFR